MSAVLLAELPPEALAVAFWAGFGQAGVDRDVALLRAGEVDAAGLLASCLRGVEDEDVARGWRAYVKALELAADAAADDGAVEPLVGAACWICSGTSYAMVGRGARCLGCKAIHYGWKLDGGAA